MTKFIFDVDGTITPSRVKIDEQFEKFFIEFCTKNKVYIATGSDYSKTLEQLGETICNTIQRSYNCCGNSVWEKGINVYNNKWKLENVPWHFLETKLIHNNFRPQTGWHFDERPGLCNFSIVGRKATPAQRQKYVEWDTKYEDRKRIAAEFNNNFSKRFNIVAQIAGETGLDIIPIGKDKSQIAEDFDNDTVFFGDKIEEGGNDYPLACAIEQLGGVVHGVESWEDTYKILSTKYNHVVLQQ